VVRSPDDVAPGDRLRVRVARGEFPATVTPAGGTTGTRTRHKPTDAT